MEKFIKYNNKLYVVTHIIIMLDVFNRTKDNMSKFLIFTGLFLFIVINNHLRIKCFYNDRIKYPLSMIMFMILSSILIYNIGGYSTIFNFTILYEIIVFTGGKYFKRLLGLQIVNILILSNIINIILSQGLNLSFWQDNLIDILFEIVYLLFYIFILFAYRALGAEKRKVDKLNKEIEKLTITKERNRLAGEIHDNLGHSLVALNMNLDVAEKIIDKDINKTKELLNKSISLSKESMESLRMAVYALKEENPRLLAEKLEEIIHNIQGAGRVEVVLKQDDEIESLPLEYKNIIYVSIKEALTNSIKHGNPDKINIDIKLDEEDVYISIQDNGIGCGELIKGNGLLGIESRIEELNGKVDYRSEVEQGFKMKIKLVI